MMNPHKITAEFEKALCEYTGAPCAVAVDNCSNALFLALYYELHVAKTYMPLNKYGCGSPPVIQIPKHTYMSVANEIIHAGAKVEFVNNILFTHPNEIDKIKGFYQLSPTNIWDSALTFTHNMYLKGQHMCLSFTGPHKHLKLGKGGAILTDDEDAYKWFKKARFSGRSECSYHDDNFDDNPVVGWNMYLMPEIAARGLLLMAQFYDRDGKPKSNPDLELPYPDLSKFKLWR
jgi:dTDP-4-amino-4,6-dideoxygalactose transaminase